MKGLANGTIVRSNEGRTSIDGHPLAAACCLFLGVFAAIIYFFTFKTFRSSDVPWKLALLVSLASFVCVIGHYFLNRVSRRLIWEGVFSNIGLFQIWMGTLSYGYVYLIFAPIPPLIRSASIIGYFGATLAYIVVAWLKFSKSVGALGLKQRLYIEEHERFVFHGAASERTISSLKAPGPKIYLPFWVVSIFGPILIAFAFVSGKNTEAIGGPHIQYIIIAILAFPFSCWWLGQLMGRQFYFHVFLPLQLERETGKRVILGP